MIAVQGSKVQGFRVTFMPYGIILKDERRTSNIERPTSNEKRISNTEHSTAISVSSSFPIQHSMLDVRCSMFISPSGAKIT